MSAEDYSFLVTKGYWDAEDNSLVILKIVKRWARGGFKLFSNFEKIILIKQSCISGLTLFNRMQLINTVTQSKKTLRLCASL
jgi:hypothetical protein